MADTVSDFLVQRLKEWGVRRIFGYPGDGINGVMGALERAQDEIEFVQVRHEEAAAFMACAHAKFTGEVGVCLATSGPGAVHLLNGLYDAAKDNAPVVAIVGQKQTTALGSDFQQEIQLTSLFKDVAYQYVEQASTPAQVRHMIDRAFRIALAERCVTCIILPSDIQLEKAVASPPKKHGSTFSGVGYRRPAIVPEERDLDAAADLLNSGKRVAMLVGAGALGAEHEVMEVAELLGAGVAKALLGKAVLPDDLPYGTGCIGLLGTKPSWDLMMECDTLLMIGTNFPYSEFLPDEGQARCVHIDVKPRMLSLRYPAEVPLHGDSYHTLRALLPRLKRLEDRRWRQDIEKKIADWWVLLEKKAHVPADPINPQRVLWELSSRLPDRSIVAADSGSAATWFARDLKLRSGMMSSLSGGLATMCPGVPYVTAAKFAYPDRPAIAVVGDGAMQMLGNNGLITLAREWPRWKNPCLVIAVLNNGDLNMVTWEQRVMAGDRKFEKAQDVPGFDYAHYARDLKLGGIRVTDPADIAGAWDQALSADRPTVIDFVTDPEVPPLPPHITLEHARGFLSSMLKGDPNLKQMLKQTVREALARWIPT